jgi:hypothetical protein
VESQNFQNVGIASITLVEARCDATDTLNLAVVTAAITAERKDRLNIDHVLIGARAVSLAKPVNVRFGGDDSIDSMTAGRSESAEAHSPMAVSCRPVPKAF